MSSSASTSSPGPTTPPTARPLPSGSTRVQCGVVSGLVVTALLNPWDRALYLAIVHDRNFLRRENFHEPYRGVGQTLIQRACSSGMFFPLEDIFASATGSTVLGGQAAAVTCGVILNPVALIKFQLWGREDRRPFVAHATVMYRNAGWKVFLRGTLSTVLRDSVFGGFFSLRRFYQVEITGLDNRMSGLYNFGVSTTFAGMATAAGAPFNYVRSKAYALSSKVPLESVPLKADFAKRVLGQVAVDVRAEDSWLGRLRLVASRFQIGWGTARVAVGMGLTSQVYDTCLRLRTHEG